MADLIELHRRSLAVFDGAMAALDESHLERPTPCAEWDVRTLIRHIVAWNFRVPHFLAGATVDAINVSEDEIGAPWQATWEASAAAAQSAFEQEGALERLVRHPAGEVPAELFAYFRLSDHVVHGWDLAAALGEQVQVDEELVGLVIDQSQQLAGLMVGSRLFAAPVGVADDADAFTRMLALNGRSAGWRASSRARV